MEKIEAKAVPALILRPSIVIPIHRDPIPGWVSSSVRLKIPRILKRYFTPIDRQHKRAHWLIDRCWKGCHSFNVLQFIRLRWLSSSWFRSQWHIVDLLELCGKQVRPNFFIDFLYYKTRLKSKSEFSRDHERSIYNLTSSADIKVSWEQLINIGRWVVNNRLPLNGVLWYPGGSMKTTRLHHNICSFFYHWVPAFFLDCLLFCLGYPPVYDFVDLDSVTECNWNFSIFLVYAAFRDVFKRDSKCSNIMPTTNGTLIMQTFCICGRL